MMKAKPKQMSSRPSQKSILAGVVVRKRPNENTECTIPNKITKEASKSTESQTESADLSVYDKGALKCIGILPGIGKYRESSDSEKSTDTDDEYDFSEFDWMGRKMTKSKEDGCHE